MSDEWTCDAEVNQDPRSFRGYFVRCGRPAKGTRAFTDRKDHPACGVHLRTKYPPIEFTPWRDQR